MCGIFGMQVKPGALSNVQKGIVASLLGAANDNRGGHSWGICALSDNKTLVNKGLNKILPHVHEYAKYDRFFAHTRFATHGEHTIENAHPFKIKHIIGAHNGVISNHEELNKKYNRKFSVDSMHIFQHIAEDKDLNDLNGYGAIEWTDGKHIYLCRLSGGELAGCMVGEKAGVIWSSSKDHLEIAVRAAGLPFKPYKFEEGKVYVVSQNKLFRAKKTLSIGSSYSHSSTTSIIEGWRRMSGYDDDDDDNVKYKDVSNLACYCRPDYVCYKHSEERKQREEKKNKEESKDKECGCDHGVWCVEHFIDRDEKKYLKVVDDERIYKRDDFTGEFCDNCQDALFFMENMCKHCKEWLCIKCCNLHGQYSNG